MVRSGIKNAPTILQRKTAMAKMLLSLGFWMTIVLFIALGYALGADCSGSMNRSSGHTAIALSE